MRVLPFHALRTQLHVYSSMRSIERLFLVLPSIVFAGSAESQISPPAPGLETPAKALQPFVEPVVTPGGSVVDARRMSLLEGSRGKGIFGGLLMRSTSSLTDPRGSELAPRAFTLVLPEVTSVTNSDLPFGQNDGALWAGKGYNYRLLAGFTASFGAVRVVAIPEFVYSSNYNLSIDPTDLRYARPLPASRSDFSSPFNFVPYSIDYPWRFGDSAIRKIYPGQSSITASFGGAQAGAATENEWWGPAIRNPLLFSDNAAGFPHVFLRTRHPISTKIGSFDGRWILGGLHESDYFDKDFTNDVRSISALSVVWKPSDSSGLSVGLARSVFAAVDGYSGVGAHAFDFLRSTGRPNARPVTDTAFTPGPDQIFSVFGHLVIPGYGLETYIEWARAELPSSIGDFFSEPSHTRGYSAGLQWARRLREGSSHFRLQAELTNVEQSSTYRFRPIGSFYTSRAAVQGYTNEGQMLAAGIGPGSSGEWIAADYFAGPLMIGANFSRTRVNNDAFFATASGDRCIHDVAIAPGLRAAFASRIFRLSTEYSKVTRYNAFFQRRIGCDSGPTAVGDRSSHHLSVTLSVLGW